MTTRPPDPFDSSARWASNVLSRSIEQYSALGTKVRYFLTGATGANSVQS